MLMPLLSLHVEVASSEWVDILLKDIFFNCIGDLGAAQLKRNLSFSTSNPNHGCLTKSAGLSKRVFFRCNLGDPKFKAKATSVTKSLQSFE